MFGNIGTSEILIVGVVLLLFFGSKKLKELAKGLGESSKEVKKIQRQMETGLFDDDSAANS